MVEPTPIGELATALGLGDHELVSFVGGGGKTTALFALARQLRGTKVLTTTTKMGRARTGGRRVLFSPSDAELTDALCDPDGDGAVLVWRADEGHKALGFDPDRCDRWFDRFDHVLVEADGSRGRPFKAPRAHEPVVPGSTTMLVACVGAAAFGRVIGEVCHRPVEVADVAGCSPDRPLTPARLAAVLSSDRGSRKGCPPSARFSVVASRTGPGDSDFLDELAAGLEPVPLIAVASFPAAESPELP